MTTAVYFTAEEIMAGKGSIKHGAGMSWKDVARGIKCNDGATLSVQGSETHYCTPRSNRGPYSAVEVGFPNPAPPESWAKYFDGDWENDDRTGSVYGYVPVDLVREYIAAHGGEVQS